MIDQSLYKVPFFIFLLFLVTTGGAAGSNEPSSEQAAEKTILLKVPLFSPRFANTPVAMVNDEPIYADELAQATEQQDTQETEGEIDYQKVLERIINSRLVVQEARNIGFDETEDIQSEIAEFRIQSLLKELINRHLEGIEPDPQDVMDVYQQISREVRLHSLTFPTSAEAQQFLSTVKDEGFEELAGQYVRGGKATEDKGEQYLKIKDLLPQIGQQVYSMKPGEVSTIFRAEDGFLLFRLVDSRFVEDEDVREEAVKIVTSTLRRQKAMEYSNMLAEKYATFDETLFEQLDFDTNLEELKRDKRVLATIAGDQPRTITVADLAAKLETRFFHGADKARQTQMINKRKDSAIANMLFRITGELEAQRLGIDQSEEFLRKIDEFERSILFREFMEKVILPDVKLTPEEVRSYYDEHIDEYSSPAMLRMNSLVFLNKSDAESALDKLRKGADFKWVSANATGFAPPDNQDILPFDERLLSLTTLPEELQKKAGEAGKGDFLLYEGEGGKYYYVLSIAEIFPPEPEPFDKARNAVARTVFDKKAEELLAEWTQKLKDAYPTEIFLTGPEGQ